MGRRYNNIEFFLAFLIRTKEKLPLIQTQLKKPIFIKIKNIADAPIHLARSNSKLQKFKRSLNLILHNLTPIFLKFP
jgi:hypothetical protein